MLHFAKYIPDFYLCTAFLAVCADATYLNIASICLTVRLTAELASSLLLIVVFTFVVEWQVVVNVKNQASVKLCIIIFFV